MIRRLCISFALLMLSLVSMMAQEGIKEDACLWTTVILKHPMKHNLCVGTLLESRLKEGVTKVDQVYFRPFLGWNPVRWCKLQMQTDLAWTDSGFSLRVLPEVSFVWHSPVKLSFRQRYMGSWNTGKGTWSNTLRSKLSLAGMIPGCIASPFIAAEPFYWNSCSRIRYGGGVKIKVNDRNDLTMEYTRQRFFNKTQADNILWIFWIVTI